jgi:hypothetical protein
MKTLILSSLLALTAVSGVVVASNSADARPQCNPIFIVNGKCVQY